MRQYLYKKVDAFSAGTSRGNPAAFLIVNDGLTPGEYLAVAKEHAGFVSEVVFCLPSKECAYKLVYYSSECEVAFCGHGTIAAMYELIRNSDMLRRESEIKIETNRKGIITVYNNIDTEDAVYIASPAPQYLDMPADVDKITKSLGISASLFSREHPLDFIDAGLRTLIIPIVDFMNEVSVYPDQDVLRAFCLDNHVDIVLIFSKEAGSEGFIAHTRVFAPKFGYLEDPATGSGNSAFGYYMLKNKLWTGTPVSIEQGGNNIRFNTVKMKVKDASVLFGGGAALRIEGVYYIP